MNFKSIIKKLFTYIGVIAFAIVVVRAAGNLFAHMYYIMNPTAGYAYSIDLTGNTTAGEIIPGGTFTIDPEITNNSTGDVYAFIRIDCASYQAVVDGPYLPIYEFTPSTESAGSWAVIDSLSDATATGASIVVAYGDGSSMSTLATDSSAQLTGSLKLNVTNTAYKDGVKNDLNVTIHGLAVHITADGDAGAIDATPKDAYDEYVRLGGD